MMNHKFSMDKREIGDRVKLTRERANYTQEQFAEMLGISVSALKKIESGENQVSVACLRKLNEGMNISADWLLFNKIPDVEKVWKNIENCSEEDKMYLLLRLLHYFTGIKKAALLDKNQQGVVTQEIKNFLENMKKHGDQ